jgi:enoyl-CoA hydratase/carnithine racemase
MTVDYTREGRVAIFVLNRPRSMNSLDIESLRQFHEALIDFRDNPDLNAGIITGAGKEAFCTGIDIRDMLYSMNKYPGNSRPLPMNLMGGLEIVKPMIAAVNGLVLGGGLEIVYSCDIRVASENAIFGTPEPTPGAVPAWGGTQRLYRRAHWHQAAEMLMNGKALKAYEACRMGLVNRVVPQEELPLAAREWAEALCNTNISGMRDWRSIPGKMQRLSRDEGWPDWDALEAYMVETEDQYEGFKPSSKWNKPFYQAR